MEYVLTSSGEEKIEQFIAECIEKRKEVLDAGIDTANETNIPTKEDIIIELNLEEMLDEKGNYVSKWEVTDNYYSDYPIELSVNEDFVEI